MTERRAILSGSAFEEQIGYARAVVDGDWVHVSGTTGFDYTTMTIPDDVVAQAEQCLRNIEAALAEAECGFADVVRVRYLNLRECRSSFTVRKVAEPPVPGVDPA
ncbi:Rid family hydrolase, partial [Streptomyces sp. NPDC049099]|uniref:Rid family hydrolase n=1 Tax=Streptomyces sp. NPDC049099 TaxID=3155768 RepID=UPI0034441E3E